MTATDWRRAATDIGLSAQAAATAADGFARAERVHANRFGATSGRRAWWVPGRIEVLGKHTDYAGGRSLLCAVERGFHVIATPRADRRIEIIDASTGSGLSTAMDAATPPQPGRWVDYPISAARRVARDFPAAGVGMDLVFDSSLPSASGLSSSSALVIATFLPIAAFNGLRASAAWAANIPDEDALAEYLGAVENGRAFGAFAADRGVGTQGGSEDHTAILRSQAGALSQYHFLPPTHEATVPIPAGWEFVVAMSGVHAAKGGAVQQQYNALSSQAAALLATWRARSGREDRSLFQAMRSSPDAAARLDHWVAESTGDTISLRRRLEQFGEETEVIIPGVVQGLRAGDMGQVGQLVSRSQSLAESALRNQVAETIHLARSAGRLGAVAASAFGAGFGGSVWALVQSDNANSFLGRWSEDYLAMYPEHRRRGVFFRSGAGPSAHEVCR